MATDSSTEREFNHIADTAPEYVEVILWRRVVLALGTLVVSLAVVGFLLFNLLSSARDDSGMDVAAINPDLLAPAGAVPASSSFATETTADTADDAVSDRSATAPQPETADTVTGTALTEAADASKSIPAPASSASDTLPTSTDKAAPQPLQVSALSDVAHGVKAAVAAPLEARFNVQTEILVPVVKRAMITRNMNGKEPGTVLTSTADISARETFSLFQFVDIRGRAGDTLTYLWKLDGKVKARVRIPVGSNKWRNYASKNFNSRLQGNWQVDVIDRKGILLVRSRFYIGN